MNDHRKLISFLQNKIWETYKEITDLEKYKEQLETELRLHVSSCKHTKTIKTDVENLEICDTCGKHINKEIVE